MHCRLIAALTLLPATGLAQSALEPKTNPGGPALTFDFPGLRIGIAEYDEGPTGTTVFWFPNRVTAVVDVRGGAPGTILTDYLRQGYARKTLDGIVFSGGSAYGLSAAGGATDALKAQRVREKQWGSPPGFAGAIIYDIGGRRLSTVTPDVALGRAAVEASVEGRFPQGARGAGRSAMQGAIFTFRGEGDWSHSGQGGAFRQVGPTKVAVFTVVNSLGHVVDRRGRIIRCSYAPSTTDCGTIDEARARAWRAIDSANPSGLSGATTITLVVTNQKLELSELQRVAVQVHTSMARGIQPFSTSGDGDALFAVTTAEVDNPKLDDFQLAEVASELAWDAILASVPALDPPRPTQPVAVAAAALDQVTGTYEFQSGARLTIRREGDSLRTAIEGGGGIFFDDEGNTLVPVAARDFLVRGLAQHRVLFEPAQGSPVRLVLNPGHWAQVARRIP